MLRQIILDTETTGLLVADGHRLIEIGCLELVNRRFTGNRFHTYINPQRPVEQGAFQVHGLSDAFLKDKPVFEKIAEEFLTFVSGAELIIHNAPFDVGFINEELKRLGKNHPPIHQSCAIIDTLALARNKHPGQSNSLDALCRRYQVDNSNRDLHGALINAQLLGQVYLAMTGGQEQLFAADDQPAQVTKTEETAVTFVQKVQRGALPVILPTPQEIQAHAEFIAMLKKKGQCLWKME